MKSELIQLIKTLSAGEKRTFKLQTKKQSTEKAYLDLYKIIDQSKTIDASSIEKEFNTLHPEKSIENAAQYLMKILTDTLIDIRIGYDPQFQIYQQIMRSKVFFERSIPEEGYKELLKAKILAEKYQNHLMHYNTRRLELDYLSKRSFEGISDHDLVNLQTKSKNLLQLLRQVQEHHSLYELLEYRLINSGSSLSENDRKKLNDLVLTELSLITRGVQHSFESQKLHLLFQSFFFTHTGDYLSAMKIFKRLNNLFEENRTIWDQPPYDYLHALEGILDSLRTINQFDEMELYINKVESLTSIKNSEHFVTICQIIALTYQIARLINSNQLHKAKTLVENIDHKFLENPGIADHKRLTHLFFYASLTFLLLEDIKKAGKYLNQISVESRQQSALEKASRLLNILVHYEMNDQDYLEYVIRSYKRNFRKRGPMLQTERLVFKLIKFDPDRNSPPSKKHYLKKIQSKLDAVRSDKYEHQLLRYYDFTDWIEGKLSNR
ncbi:hypothetical protein [Membranihabitans maritimus]|uniref:hypothetical protein n=1 Tax=Membranihabitans maritimus TaxID=2904244 RepID=UPI001F485B20|nr:hypothetical protein [Membranihabitans maritimus]